MEAAIPDDLPRLASRAVESHKGDYGRALLVGGSRGMCGAIALSGMATLRSGAGLVKLAVPENCLDTVAQFDPCYMTASLDQDDQGRIASSSLEAIHELAQTATCVALGPGLGRSEGLTKLVGWLYRILPQPMVIDADGLNALAASAGALSHPGGPRILTPHPGEYARLQAAHSPEATATALAAQYGLVVVLKGHRTLVTDGKQEFHNTSGNPGLAKGGSGDVLTGVITALICQDLKPLDAARLGAFTHGVAGDIAAEKLGHIGMTAVDLIEALPEAWRRVG